MSIDITRASEPAQEFTRHGTTQAAPFSDLSTGKDAHHGAHRDQHQDRRYRRDSGMPANAAGEVSVVFIHTSITLRRWRPIGIDEQGFDIWGDVWTEPVVTIATREQGDEDLYALAAELGHHLPELGWHDIEI